MPSPQMKLNSPLGDDLKLQSLSITEGISILGQMQLDLLSPHANLQPEDLLGQPVTVTLRLRGTSRYFNGYITRSGARHHRGRYFAYTATVHPWLWFLGRTSDCRLFTPENIGDNGGKAPNTMQNIVESQQK
jgi:type VI secretion system secreted protein VgrG